MKAAFGNRRTDGHPDPYSLGQQPQLRSSPQFFINSSRAASLPPDHALHCPFSTPLIYAIPLILARLTLGPPEILFIISPKSNVFFSRKPSTKS